MGKGLTTRTSTMKRSKSFDDLNPKSNIRESDSKQVIKIDFVILEIA
jgi:hypothetical protein